MSTPQSGRVSIEKGVVFGKGGGRELRCDVYTPPQPEPAAPAVLLVHGGGWRQGDREQLRGYGVLLGRHGFVCVASEYRLSGEASWPAQIHDTKAALRFVRANADALGIDPGRIAVSGNSAGGHLALVLAGTPGVRELEGDGGHAGTPTHVAAAIAFYAPTLLTKDAPGEAVSALMADAPPEAYRAASPVHHARADFPPTLLLHGNRDQTVPESASLAMYRALSEAGAPVELRTYNGAPHAFDAVPELGRECAEIMRLFLDRHVVRPRGVTLPAVAAR